MKSNGIAGTERRIRWPALETGYVDECYSRLGPPHDPRQGPYSTIAGRRPIMKDTVEATSRDRGTDITLSGLSLRFDPDLGHTPTGASRRQSSYLVHTVGGFGLDASYEPN